VGFMKKKRSYLLFLSFLISVLPDTYAQELEMNVVDTTSMIDFTLFSPSDPFAADSPLVINLEFDIREFIRKKPLDEYMPAILSYTNDEGKEVRTGISIKARGEFRLEYCSLPPIKLKLINETTGNESLNSMRTVKLVTHCNNSETYQQYLLKEYLIYRMYNQMTDYSYRVRLLIINYFDSVKKIKMYTRYGFVLEGDRHLAERINAVEIERNLSDKLIDAESYHQLAVFQFMVGNTDWSVPAIHNIKLFKFMSFQREYPVAIPYDFDYSGMVNAFYALPDEKLDIKTVRERMYRGYCIPAEDFEPFFQKFYEKKDVLYSLVINNTYLDKHHRKEMIVYLDEFFHILDTPRLRENLIIKSCREL